MNFYYTKARPQTGLFKDAGQLKVSNGTITLLSKSWMRMVEVPLETAFLLAEAEDGNGCGWYGDAFKTGHGYGYGVMCQTQYGGGGSDGYGVVTLPNGSGSST